MTVKELLDIEEQVNYLESVHWWVEGIEMDAREIESDLRRLINEVRKLQTKRK